VSETLRVLRPGGCLLHCWDEHDDSSMEAVATMWVRLVEELGGTAYRVGAEAPRVVSAWLREQGLPVEEVSIARWETTSTPRHALESIASRLHSRTWHVPDELFAVSMQRLEAWALDYFGADRLDAPHTRVNQFIAHKTRLP